MLDTGYKYGRRLLLYGQLAVVVGCLLLFALCKFCDEIQKDAVEALPTHSTHSTEPVNHRTYRAHGTDRVVTVTDDEQRSRDERNDEDAILDACFIDH
jgi:hypothetical protein